MPTNLSELVWALLSDKQLRDILRILVVTPSKGNKPVLVETVTGLFAQQDGISSSNSSRNRQGWVSVSPTSDPVVPSDDKKKSAGKLKSRALLTEKDASRR